MSSRIVAAMLPAVRPRTLALLLTTVTILALKFAAVPAYALSSPCALDRNNLIDNGAMREGGLSQWGPVADGWSAFVMGGDAPTFDHADNEGIDPYGSQYIFADDQQYDAGIYQTVPNLQPGVYYHFWVGYALAAYDNGDTVNRRYDQIGRMVGVDPTGGTDPHSAAVQWGSETTSGKAALKISNMDRTFAALADHVTVFVRAINHSSQYRNKVWFDAICMEARTDLATATPLATVTRSPAPTNTARPTRLAVTSLPPTEAPTDIPTATATETTTPTTTSTPTASMTPSETPRPRHAIPQASPAAADATADLFPGALFFGSVGVIFFGLIGMLALFGVGFWQVARHRVRSPRYRTGQMSLDGYDEMDQFNEAIEPRLPPEEQLPGDIF